MVALDLVDHAARDAVEHEQGNLKRAHEWLAERLLVQLAVTSPAPWARRVADRPRCVYHAAGRPARGEPLRMWRHSSSASSSATTSSLTL